jgi:hypothetical protein
MQNDDLKEQFNKIVEGYGKELREAIEKGLTLGAAELQKVLEDASPVDTKEFKESWSTKMQYKGVRYIGNTRAVKGKTSSNIPLANILEYSEASKHKGFISKAFNASESRIYKIMTDVLK